MRFKSIIAVSLFMILLATLLPGNAEGTVTYDPYEVQPGVYIPLKLQGMDKKGDKLELTIVFKGITSDDYISRGIDVYVLEKTMADQVTNDLRAEMSAVYMKKDFTERTVIEIENPKNSQMSVLFFNRIRGNDTENDDTWNNATVNIRIDYDVTDAESDTGTNFVPILMVLLGVVFVIVAIIVVIILLKRRTKDATTFFNPEEGPYYAFKSILDGKIYYLDPDQYARLYSSNSLGEYDFMGTASRIGGTIMPPDDVGIEAVTSMPMEGQMMAAVPIEGGQPPVDISNMDATPIDPNALAIQQPVDGEPTQVEGGAQTTYDDLYGTQEAAQDVTAPEQQTEVKEEIPMNGEPEPEQQPEVTDEVPLNGEPAPQEEEGQKVEETVAGNNEEEIP